MLADLFLGHLFLLFDLPPCPPQEACQASKHPSFCQWLPGPPPSCGDPLRTPSEHLLVARWGAAWFTGPSVNSHTSHWPLGHVLWMEALHRPGICPHVDCSDVQCLGPGEPHLAQARSTLGEGAARCSSPPFSPCKTLVLCPRL